MKKQLGFRQFWVWLAIQLLAIAWFGWNVVRLKEPWVRGVAVCGLAALVYSVCTMMCARYAPVKTRTGSDTRRRDAR